MATDGAAAPINTHERRRAIRIVLPVLAVLAALGFAAPAEAVDLDARAVATRITGYFQSVQAEDGNVSDPLGGPAQRYSQAMLGYSALRLSQRSGDAGTRAFALRALDWVAAHPESNTGNPSVFEIGAAASAFNALADAPGDPVRQRLGAWLAAAPAVFVRDDGRYAGNKYLVEAYALLELCKAGTALRPDAPALCRRGRGLITRGLAGVADRAVARDERGRPVVVVSDPPANPIAYHQLVAGYLARSLTLMGNDRATADLLVRAARGVAALAAPDGDVAYWGRSQDQGWSLLFGAYGLREAARHTDRVEAGEFRATADQLVARFRALHVGGPYGTFITPSFVPDPLTRPKGIDPYANAATYAGLTAFALTWLSDQGAQPAHPAARSSSRRSFTGGRGVGAFATVRRGPVWFAVRQQSDGSGDLRYDFGLAAAKVKTVNGWQDLLPIKPMTIGAADTTGPLLRVGGRLGYPHGTAISVRDDGSVLVAGGWRTADGAWLRHATFRFTPSDHGVNLSVPVRRGDELEYSVFSVDPRLNGQTLQDGERRTTVSSASVAQVIGGYANGANRELARVRLAIEARQTGQLRIRHSWPSSTDALRRGLG